jgi:hypothetical protein
VKIAGIDWWEYLQNASTKLYGSSISILFAPWTVKYRSMQFVTSYICYIAWISPQWTLGNNFMIKYHLPIHLWIVCSLKNTYTHTHAHAHTRARARSFSLSHSLSPCLSLTVIFQHCLAFRRVHKICEQRILASSYVCPSVYPQETTYFSEILYRPFLRKSDHHSQIWQSRKIITDRLDEDVRACLAMCCPSRDK